MDRELARQLKMAGFPVVRYQSGHKFYPNEAAARWSEAARAHGVTINRYELNDHAKDIESGYYCPNLSDLIGACGDKFARLFVMKSEWFAESDAPEMVATGDTPEEAVAKLWLLLRKLRTS
jgi:hypothetical protein